MATTLINHMQRPRRNFSNIRQVIEVPNLMDVQRKSYEKFLQARVPGEERTNEGLHGVFKSVFPIKDFNETASLEYVGYKLEDPKYDVDECVKKGLTYSCPLRVVVRLVVWDATNPNDPGAIKDVKEQEVYFGEIPLMTSNGTFIVNGTERVVVSQLHRSPGVFFFSEKGDTVSRSNILYSARILPYRGSWLDFEYDHREIINVRIDRRRKMPVTILLKALGYSDEEILDYFYKSETFTFGTRGKISKNVNSALLVGQKASLDIIDPKSKKVLVKQGRKITKFTIRKIEEAKITSVEVDLSDLVGRVSAKDIVDPATGEVILGTNQVFSDEVYEKLLDKKIKEVDLLFIDGINVNPAIRNSLLADKITNYEEALMDICARLRPGDPPTLETATAFFENLFFNPERYDLSEVGRLKINHKFSFKTPLETRTLSREDIMATVKYLADLKDGRGVVDDIDHLGNRRVRSVGELVEIQYRIGLIRMERAIRERMSLQDLETLMPHELVNSKPVQAVLKEFFGSSQLSQFMDQTNPLSSVTHKRRLSALGPGGLTRDRAGFEVRDVHTTHYGRICPVETPEGPNIGLITSLSTYARVNDHGFIDTPYRVVKNSKVTDEVVFLTALEEELHVIAQANAILDKSGKFTSDFVSARKGGEFTTVDPAEITLMDVSPNQLVSVAASLIPFLENDDANRALMGSNMQRQAVPLLRTEAPIVGTGIEAIVAKDSGSSLVAANDGVVEEVDASRIVIKTKGSAKEGSQIDIYNLIKYQRSNQGSCINQRVLVKKGDDVKRGDVIADGPSTSKGELALGRNVIVAFMPWNGYNFEDSILLSEKLVENDVYTSVHIESFEVMARDTKLGKEELTRDIPNMSEEALKNLDESGIIRIGAEVRPGDILVGKITPKGETQLSPEEKLLRAIFGDKAGDVKDTSLRVPPSIYGTVIDAHVFCRDGVEKDQRHKNIEDEYVRGLLEDQEDQIRIISQTAYDNVRRLMKGKTTNNKIDDKDGNKLAAKGDKLTDAILTEIPNTELKNVSIKDGDKVEEEMTNVLSQLKDQITFIKTAFSEKIEKIKTGDELPPGVIKTVRVFVATKRKISVGDKMAGRHGNKGVVSKLVPVEDMPYLEDGTPVDVVLNPLGVPSRMNVGQILEVHLGWAGRKLGDQIQKMVHEKFSPDKIKKYLKDSYDGSLHELIDSLSEKEIINCARIVSKEGVHMATPVFDGAHDKDIKELLKLAGEKSSGQSVLYDGKTGEKFMNDVTVGVMYMLKLHHLVDDKIHARSIGPYSLVTQQPLGGKAQFGGQRLGEMEVWALEAYGAAYALQEFLTVKSDDISGRTNMYEAIVKGESRLECGIPESFNVLTKELKALGLDIRLLEAKDLETAQPVTTTEPAAS
ncbi:MAG: DNA-directed RNA polymerase subunit beta [Bdellovibrionales bacterium]|nr:DNA-directed RNA polymerase subunit beta [Bdellovibrionales bacterium]